MAQTKAVIIVTHSTRVFGPPFALANYCQDQGWDVLLIDHPLDYEPTRQSRVAFWQAGQLVWERTYPNWLAARPINYLKDFLVTTWALLRYGARRRFDYYIGCDSLVVLAGLWLRPFLTLGLLVGYNTDYSTTRFDSPFLNRIYLWADRYTMHRVDAIWCVTKRILAVRKQERPDHNHLFWVPNGVYLNKVSANGKHDQGLVFIGNLTQEKGIDDLLKALVKTKKTSLTIYGDGGERLSLERLAKKLGLTARVTFAGQKNNQQILKELARYQAGVALYQDSRSYVYYSDPLKVKEYLAAGLPVIITRVPEIAEIIDTAGAGVVIDEPSQLVQAIDQLTGREKTARAAALRLAKEYDWDTIFTDVFTKLDRAKKE